jgi:hypothetical protein
MLPRVIQQQQQQQLNYQAINISLKIETMRFRPPDDEVFVVVAVGWHTFYRHQNLSNPEPQKS